MSLDAIGEGVAVVFLIHHFVGVMVEVMDTGVAVASSMFASSSPRRDTLLKSGKIKHRNNNTKTDMISIL